MNYEDLDGLALAELVSRGEVSPLELVNTAIEHIEAKNPTINAVVNKQYEKAREMAQSALTSGPFCGVPFLLKDLGAFELGVASTSGSRYCKDFMPRVQNEIVKRYLKAGFIPLGRTNTAEFGLLPTTEPKLFGPTKNPWNTTHTAGGSSGGAAAAVAARMVPIAHGGDGGGSLRIPASCCGVFGLKPSEGRSPVGPVGGRLWHGLVAEHVLTRSVRDSAACLDVICAPTKGEPIHAPAPEQSFLEQLKTPVRKLKIGLIEEPYFNAQLHPDCREAVQGSAKLCESLGHEVEQTKFSIDAQEVAHAYLVIVAGETEAVIRNLESAIGKKPTSRDLELVTQIFRIGGRTLRASDYADAVRISDETRRKVAATFANYDVILTPTLALPPPRLGQLNPPFGDRLFMHFMRLFPLRSLVRAAFNQLPKKAFGFTPYTFLFNTTGQPAMSVPLHWNKQGLPIGSHFIGEFGADGLLLKLAQQLESARPFSARKLPNNISI